MTSYADKDSEKGVKPFMSQKSIVRFRMVPTDSNFFSVI